MAKETVKQTIARLEGALKRAEKCAKQQEDSRRAAEKESIKIWQESRALEAENNRLKQEVAGLQRELAEFERVHKTAVVEFRTVRARQEAVAEAVATALKESIVAIVDAVRK